ncbi:unnamed protein product [Schistosoma mattheei]|uniref:Mvd1 C-terminal domain-containing protein n=1 Tax=Schistosoma mattheei TaxID=31246 RepID=A0A183PNC6_9TREM|nr:unnamed protein product [Schistosoma mattheei]
MSGALTGSVDMEDPPRGVGEPLFQTSGAHGLQYLEGRNGEGNNKRSSSRLVTYVNPQYTLSFKDRKDPDHTFTLGSEQIEVVGKFVHLGSCIIASGDLSGEVNSRIGKAGAACANLDHLCRLCDLSLAVKGQIYNVSVAYTFDAGPNAFLLTESQNISIVLKYLVECFGYTVGADSFVNDADKITIKCLNSNKYLKITGIPYGFSDKPLDQVIFPSLVFRR